MNERVTCCPVLAVSVLVALTAGAGCHLVLGIEDTRHPLCGDGTVDESLGEECDDGNHDDSDACPATCKPAVCGDGHVQLGVERCDDGNNDTGDDCPDGPGGSCQFSTCGDGFVHALEEMCDDGNGNVNDGCPDGPGAFCENAFCGDGFLFTGTEECDFGAFDSCPDSQTCNVNCICV